MSIFTGCASFYQSSEVISEHKVLTRPLAMSVKITKFTFLENAEQVDQEIYDEVQKDTLNSIKNVYSKDPSFRLVDIDSPNQDIFIEIELIKKYQSATFMKVLSGLTLYIIPRRSQENIIYSTKFYNKDRELLGQVELSDELITWRHILLAPLWPFLTSYNSSYLKVLEYITQQVIEISKQDSYFINIK